MIQATVAGSISQVTHVMRRNTTVGAHAWVNGLGKVFRGCSIERKALKIALQLCSVAVLDIS